MSDESAAGGMTAAQARRIELSIIGLCIAALVCVFQPFSQTLFTIGAGLVVLAGLAFNLVPLCRPGVPLRSLVKAGIVVLALLLIVAALSIGAALLYGVYLEAQRPA